VNLVGQKTTYIMIGVLDTLELFLDPGRNFPLKIKSGLISIVQDIALPEADTFIL
jgi:hypothetical protein